MEAKNIIVIGGAMGGTTTIAKEAMQQEKTCLINSKPVAMIIQAPEPLCIDAYQPTAKQFICKGKHQYRPIEKDWICQCGRNIND